MHVRPLLMFVCVSLLVASAVPSAASTVSVKQFGAKGDGVTDDYAAMVSAAKYLCAHPGYTLVYPSGHYEIKRYKIMGGPHKNSVHDIVYNGCSNVTISGVGATIDVKGDFIRTADYKTANGKHYLSYSNEVAPFSIMNSDGVTVTGFTLNGNVEQMQRAPGVIEGPNHGIVTLANKNLTFENMVVHSFAADGLYIGASTTFIADRNVTIKNVRSQNNARMGMDIVQVRGARIVDSVFVYNGYVSGKYGHHAPAAGVDVEPNFGWKMDVPTGDIVFEHDTFSGNLGFQIVTMGIPRVESVTIDNCTINASKNKVGFSVMPIAGTFTNNTFTVGSISQVTTYKYMKPSMISTARKVVFRYNTFNLAIPNSLSTALAASTAYATPGATVVFDQNTIRFHPVSGSYVDLHTANQVTNNSFVAIGSGYPQTMVKLPAASSTVLVSNNTFTVAP